MVDVTLVRTSADRPTVPAGQRVSGSAGQRVSGSAGQASHAPGLDGSDRKWTDAAGGQAQLSGVRNGGRRRRFFFGQATVVMAGALFAVFSLASGPLAVWDRPRTSMPR